MNERKKEEEKPKKEKRKHIRYGRQAKPISYTKLT